MTDRNLVKLRLRELESFGYGFPKLDAPELHEQTWTEATLTHWMEALDD